MTTVTWNRFNDIASKYFTQAAMIKIFNVHVKFKLKDDNLSKPVIKLLCHHALKQDTKTMTQIDLMLNELFT